MPRNRFGQFEKGTCGNPRGRPRKLPLRISDEKMRQHFFDVAETPIQIVENGQRTSISAHVAIERQLVKKALSGDTRAICEYNKRFERFTLDHVKLQLANLEAIAMLKIVCAGFPRTSQTILSTR